MTIQHVRGQHPRQHVVGGIHVDLVGMYNAKVPPGMDLRCEHSMLLHRCNYLTPLSKVSWRPSQWHM